VAGRGGPEQHFKKVAYVTPLNAASRGLEGLLQAGKRLEVDDFKWLRAVGR